MTTIQKDCACCGTALFSATKTAAFTDEQFRQAWKDAAGDVFGCSGCGCDYRTQDDGVAAAQGGEVSLLNESKPRIDSIGTSSGPAAGSTTVRVNGHAFSHAVPTVKFDGVAGTNLTVIDDGSLDVDTPAGSGTVDVSVENEHGQRNSGGTLAGAFTYT